MKQEIISNVLGQGDSPQENQADSSQDVNLEELAELVFKKLHQELLLENDRVGRALPGR